MSDTKNWINHNIHDGHKVNDSYQSIADFCLMWALFEGTELHRVENTVDELEEVANRLYYQIRGIEPALDFWSDRFTESGEFNQKFRKLRFSHAPHEALVKSVLLKENTNRSDILHALLLIVYRIRNNLFHGEKDITRIFNQKSNFINSSYLLQRVIESSNRLAFINQR